MLTKASYKNAFENPDLACVFEQIHNDFTLNRLIFAETFEQHGYIESADRVRESIKDQKPTHDEICYAHRVLETFSLDPEEYDLSHAFKDLRFFNHKKTGEAHGFLDFEGHRFTVAKNPDSKAANDKYVVSDLKSGNVAYAGTSDEAKALAYRHYSNEQMPYQGADRGQLSANAKDQLNGPAFI